MDIRDLARHLNVSIGTVSRALNGRAGVSTKTREHSKTNMMIFLRPTLVRDSRRADAFTGERYDYVLGEQGKAKPERSAVLPDMGSPTLPPRPAPATETKPSPEAVHN